MEVIGVIEWVVVVIVVIEEPVVVIVWVILMDRNKIAYLAWMRGNECIHSPLFTAFFLISNYQ